MAYCKHCGAYMPDGLSACLACGYDEAAGEDRSAAAAREENEDYRLKYEQERARRQEENRRWAEQERLRREEEERRRQAEEERRRELLREQEAERRRREDEELRRIQAERESRARAQAYRAAASEPRGKSRIFAALSYLSVLFILPRLFCEDDAFARYHGRQGLALFVFGILCDGLGKFVPFGWALSLFRLYCIYKGMFNALNDRQEPLPLIGQFMDR